MSRSALITGAGRGIGAATARALGRRGFHVVVNYRADAEAAGRTADEVRSAGGTASLAQADVRDPAQAADLVAGCATLDALACSANVQPPFASFATMPWPGFADKVGGELAAVFHVSQRALEAMRERGSGRVVYVSSLSAELTRPGAIAHTRPRAHAPQPMRPAGSGASRQGLGPGRPSALSGGRRPSRSGRTTGSTGSRRPLSTRRPRGSAPCRSAAGTWRIS